MVALEGPRCDKGNFICTLRGGTRSLGGCEHPSSQHLLELFEAGIHLSLDG